MNESNVTATKAVNEFLLNAMLLADGYKTAHYRMYPKGMTMLYSSFIPRSNHHYPEADKGCVVFGIQYFIKKVLIDLFQKNFFNLPKEEVVSSYYDLLESFVGKEMANNIGTEHIAALHDLGYLPIKIKALKEGTYCPIGVPALTICSTHPNFAWLTNYLETIISNEIWLPLTSATTSDIFKRELIRHAKKTGFYNPSDTSNLDFLCHDFSMRGMQGIDSTIASGMAHLINFCGSESIPAIKAIDYYYPKKNTNTVVAATVAASEHSVMCSNMMVILDEIREGKYDSDEGCKKYIDVRFKGCSNTLSLSEGDLLNIAEYILFRKLITEIFPNGFVSLVSDSFDFWNVIQYVLPALKDEIMNRDGRVVVRPDSGEPVKIICGDPDSNVECVRKGAYECLYDLFGGTYNEFGYKVLDSHIGLLYGDSITVKREHAIYEALEEKGFAATNLVLGEGSYSLAFVSRDSLGFAMKANFAVVDNEPIEVYKDPKTVVGMPKKSLRGLIKVDWIDSNNHSKGICAYDRVSPEDEETGMLHTVFLDGKLIKEYSIEEVRDNLNKSRNGILCYE
jgi:nicotinamide phosphoribosyltransferase